MWKSLFLALGITLLILGVQFLGVEKIVLRLHDDPPAPVSPFDNEVKIPPKIEIHAQPWTPYSLLSTGAIVCLYSIILPKRFGK
jgi:hypothetical protein